jgi:hypothetical protein
VPFVISFVAELMMAWTPRRDRRPRQAGDPRQRLDLGLSRWLGFVATTMLVYHSFSGTRPALTAIDGGHWLAVLLVQGAVIGAFGAP